MFPCIITRTTMTDIISNGVSGSTRNGALQLMQAELQVLSPLVTIHKVNFLRFCKQHGEGIWVVVDVSVDDICGNSQNRSNAPSCRRLPSGYVVQDMPNGYSKVRNFLVDDPGNSEYADMEKELEEKFKKLYSVIELTEDLLATTRQPDDSELVSQLGSNVSSSQIHFNEASRFEMGAGELTGSHERFSVSTRVQAVYSEDGEWYDATIEALSENGYFIL